MWGGVEHKKTHQTQNTANVVTRYMWLDDLHCRMASLNPSQSVRSFCCWAHWRNCLISHAHGPEPDCDWSGCENADCDCWATWSWCSWGAGESFDPPLNIPVIPWATVDPIATPAAVVAICCNIPKNVNKGIKNYSILRKSWFSLPPPGGPAMAGGATADGAAAAGTGGGAALWAGGAGRDWAGAICLEKENQLATIAVQLAQNSVRRVINIISQFGRELP